VSTDDQSLENQLQALQAAADKRGWQVVETYSDFAVSGAKGRLQRPGLDWLCKDAQRGRFDLVTAWSIDRLGRSLADLSNTCSTPATSTCISTGRSSTRQCQWAGSSFRSSVLSASSRGQ
jgi:hypothetical protein